MRAIDKFKRHTYVPNQFYDYLSLFEDAAGGDIDLVILPSMTGAGGNEAALKPTVSAANKVKMKLGIPSDDTSQDNLLNLYLEDAEEFILETSHLEEIPTGLLSTQIDLAIIYYNKQGIEGQTAHSEGGINRTFDDIPESIMRKIRSCRRLPR